MIVIIPHPFENLGPFLREELPKIIWQTACDSVIGGKLVRQVVGDHFRQWKIKIDSSDLIQVRVRAGLSCRFRSGYRRFLISAQPSPQGTRVEIIETKSWGWLTVSVVLALLFFIIPGIFRIIGNMMWTRRNRLVLESVAAKICLLFPETQIHISCAPPVGAIPKRSALPPPAVPVAVTAAAAPIIQGWTPPPVPPLVKPSINSSTDDAPQMEADGPSAEQSYESSPPPSLEQWAPLLISSESAETPLSSSGEAVFVESPAALIQPGFFALHRLKIIGALVTFLLVAGLALAWPWISNEIFNTVPPSAQITDFISPLIDAKLDHSPAVKTDISVSKITKTGRGEAEAQVHASVIAQDDFLDRVDFAEAAKVKGYDDTSFTEATHEALSLPQDFAPAALSVPIPLLARITTPKGTQHDYDFEVSADRVGRNWNLSLSPDQTPLAGVVIFSGTPRSLWTTQPEIVDSPSGEQAVALVIAYRRSFVAAVEKAKANYAKFQEEELQRKQATATAPTGTPSAASGGDKEATSPASPAQPTNTYPAQATIKGKIALCLRAPAGGQDAVLVQCDNADGQTSNMQGTVMLIGYPAAATSKVGDNVDVQGGFVSTVTINMGNGKSVVDPQYRCTAVKIQNPDDQLNALYQQIISSGKVDADAMKKIQLKWIAYRDTEAGFEASIGQSTPPDEAVRQAAQARITTKRVAELQHIFLDGFSGDPPPNSSELQGSLQPTFAAFIQALSQSGNSQIVMAFVGTEKAWDLFAAQQANLDRQSFEETAAYLENERVEELKTLAASMRITLLIANANNNSSEPDQPEQSTQENAPAPADKPVGPSLAPGNIGGNAYKGRGTVYAIPDLNSLVGKDLSDAWLYGSFLLFNQNGNQAVCHPKTAWSVQSNDVHIEFDELVLPDGIWKEIANAQQALAIYESGDVNAYNSYTSQNPCASILFVAKKEHPLKLIRVYRQRDGSFVALTKAPGAFRVVDGAGKN